MKATVRVLCIIVGIIFIASGFVKAIDPIGFSYKLEEYFEVFAAETEGGWFLPEFFHFLKSISLWQSMFFVVLEMVLGVMLLFGIRMPLTAWLLLLLILFFTWLTGYSAITGKVKECGCFGDAIPLTAWTSFYKDLVLTVIILLIFFYRKKITPVFRPVMSNLVLVISTGLFVYLTVYCYRHLPIIDFRAYKPGSNIREQMTLPPGQQPDQYVSILQYRDKNTGSVARYVMVSGKEDQEPWFRRNGYQRLPWDDSLWMASHEFVDSQSELVQAGAKPKITDFYVWDQDNMDQTAAVLDEPQGFHFWVVSYDLLKAPPAAFEQLNTLARECEVQQIPFIALTATPYAQMDPLRHEWNAAYPFYFADATVLKTIIRSNPGLVLLKGPVVVDMWHYRDVPSFEQIRSRHFR